MASAAHDTHATSTTSDGPLEHPDLPTVRDEAGDTPTWLPVLGLALFALLLGVWLFRMAAREQPAETAELGMAAPAN